MSYAIIKFRMVIILKYKYELFFLIAYQKIIYTNEVLQMMKILKYNKLTEILSKLLLSFHVINKISVK